MHHPPSKPESSKPTAMPSLQTIVFPSFWQYSGRHRVHASSKTNGLLPLKNKKTKNTTTKSFSICVANNMFPSGKTSFKSILGKVNAVSTVVEHHFIAIDITLQEFLNHSQGQWPFYTSCCSEVSLLILGLYKLQTS